MIPDISIPVLVLIALGVVGLLVAVQGFSMPQSFFKNQEKKEELRKMLEKNREKREKP